ncbi:SDR family NAD(P)-dependent oxidoreductase [Gymnodinialimonas sp. 57CJ19]|uniref:SDR family NAD(P)-dependent oxidoreductase n=1 Tax=Gymnodinialimonas sp. 57CJ19 TaxID=3138498 RepID=UPI0031345B48
MKDFDKKVVAITGAAHGIGRAITLGFADAGADLAIFDIDGEALEQTAEDARALGAKVHTMQGDFIDLDTIVAAFSGAVEALGPVDVLVNNLGQTAREATTPFSEAKHDTLDFVLDISLRAAVHCTREVVASMKDRKAGRIISISSDSAFNGDLGCVDYAAAKSGVLGFMRGLAREIGPYGMTANAVCPGPTNTRAMQRIPRDSFERARDAVPMKQICEPEDIANAVLFLASDKARYITGQALLVNGGRVFH